MKPWRMDITLSANMFHPHVLEKKIINGIDVVKSLEMERRLPNKMTISQYLPTLSRLTQIFLAHAQHR